MLLLRAVNYVVSPFLYQAVNKVEEALHKITPEQWQQILAVVRQVLRPVFLLVDWIRLGLVRAYIHDRRCFQALAVETKAVSSILYHQMDPKDTPTGWTPQLSQSTGTTQPVFALLLALSPILWASDIFRCWLVKVTTPELRGPVDDRFDAIWAYTFGGTLGATPHHKALDNQ